LSIEERKNIDDYLELIYIISEEESKGIARIKEISKELGVYPSTATEMMQKLSKKGFVKRLDYEGVKLTEPGKKRAMDVLSRHRILECFFMQYLEMDPADVKMEICGIEHHLSYRVLIRLYHRLGNPKFSPQGKPIPLELDDPSA
jgi:DtxR family Mn-dependent transcriptional regulator